LAIYGFNGVDCINHAAYRFGSLQVDPPTLKTNPSSGWFFFAYFRVFTRVVADSCGLRGFMKYHKFAHFFSLSANIHSPPLDLFA
ncbi:hypothetical protein, partial [Nitrosomonas nitrosa]|uniref:hypothetical protein n=1 Tax=Nitrosomonas nitrosa TaxID=52442 RepID=UPI0023F84110